MSGFFRGVDEVDFPMFLLLDEQSRNLIVSAEFLSGFFVDPEQGVESPVRFRAVHQIDGAAKKSETAVLEILSRQQQKIGEYYIGRVARVTPDDDAAVGKVATVAFGFFGNRCYIPEAAEVWSRWASGVPLDFAEWSRWPTEYHDAWLHVVQNSWFASGRSAPTRAVGENIYIDGARFSTRSGFYCAIGEAFNGAGGYLGSNLDALADCVSSIGDRILPLKVVWQNLGSAEDLLGGAFVKSVLDIMGDFGIEVDTC